MERVIVFDRANDFTKYEQGISGSIVWMDEQMDRQTTPYHNTTNVCWHIKKVPYMWKQILTEV